MMTEPDDTDPLIEIALFIHDDADDPDTFCERAELIGESLEMRDMLFNQVLVGKA